MKTKEGGEGREILNIHSFTARTGSDKFDEGHHLALEISWVVCSDCDY